MVAKNLHQKTTFYRFLKSLRIDQGQLAPGERSVEEVYEKEHLDALFTLVQGGAKYTIVEQDETAVIRKGGALLQVAFESRYRLEPGVPFYHTFDATKRGLEKFHRALSGIHGDLNPNRKLPEQSIGMTVGVELEVKAVKETVEHTADVFQLTMIILPKTETERETRGGDAEWEALLNARPVLFKNKNISLACEVNDANRTCFFEFITQKRATQSTELLQESTDDMLFVAQHLWHYINCPPPSQEDRPEQPTIEDFVRHYNTLLKTESVSADTHPPLELIEWCVREDKHHRSIVECTSVLDANVAKLLFRLPDARKGGGYTPQLDPQVTFTLPLERVQAFYRSSETLFSLTHELQGVSKPKPWNVRSLEQAAVTVGNQFVDGFFLGQWPTTWSRMGAKEFYRYMPQLQKGTDSAIPEAEGRLLQKLRGLFSIIALYGLTARFEDDIQTDGVAHSGLAKNSYGFLPKSSIYHLIRRGLGEEDRALLLKAVTKRPNKLENILLALINNVEKPLPLPDATSMPPGKQDSRRRYLPVWQLTEPAQGVLGLSKTYALYPFLPKATQGTPCKCSQFASG
ncbi:hypothetical protein SAMN05443572_1063 [Myxococcus fulvus]|uniref:Uncharacterized protein n=1 Tax=Myxococcus fulvus TaxID=33 RepID=A0A511TH34_MYXFU|nr:hypothetical protein [Myxococcus fulvus]GEN13485.1 hypothetical protein MFU01_85220 [Myxococcus fulvus]SEU19342.1 hypothetical protein SAMN05443572_1063 [Myxococcus fulvus]